MSASLDQTLPDVKAARREGATAHGGGSLWSDCPYPYGSEACQWWRRGWSEADMAAVYHREATIEVTGLWPNV